MTQRTFLLPRFGWRTFSVGQIHISKAHKHIAGAHMLERIWLRHKSRVIWDSELHADGILGAMRAISVFVARLFVSLGTIIILGNPKIAQPLSLNNGFVVGTRTKSLKSLQRFTKSGFP